MAGVWTRGLYLAACVATGGCDTDRDLEVPGGEVPGQRSEVPAMPETGPAPAGQCLPSPDPCAGSAGMRARYQGYACDTGKLFIETAAITCREALENCKTNFQINLRTGVVCGWNGREVFRGEAAANACAAFGPAPGQCCTEPVHPCEDGLGRADFVVYDCLDGAVMQQVSALSCPEALAYCQNVDAQLPQSVSCRWNAREIFRSRKDLAACVRYGPAPISCRRPAPAGGQ